MAGELKSKLVWIAIGEKQIHQTYTWNQYSLPIGKRCLIFYSLLSDLLKDRACGVALACNHCLLKGNFLFFLRSVEHSGTLLQRYSSGKIILHFFV